jgi:uncharacterized protein YuzE
MKLHCSPEADSLTIGLTPEPGEETREIAAGLNADLNLKGEVVGLDIDRASHRLALTTLEAIAPPLRAARVA